MSGPITRTAVVYEYAPDSERLHAEHGQEHVAFLQRLMDESLLNLSGRIDMDGRPGALLVLACDAGEALRALNEDPFWISGVVAERRIWPWTVVFGAERLAR